MPARPVRETREHQRGELARLRTQYHYHLKSELLALRSNAEGVPNIADTDNRVSVTLARGIVEALGLRLQARELSPQTIGQKFSEITCNFLRQAFARLGHLRPGGWVFSTAQAETGITAFDQYEHIAQLQELLTERSELQAALGGDYLITPDITLARHPVDDAEINGAGIILGPSEEVARRAPLRASNSPQRRPILHASISCKWTMRSDRAQNSRTEALNLIRNRKGNAPHIVAVTFEPVPSRLASLAMGTGDLDCTYHVALPELIAAAAETDFDDAKDLLNILVEGRRLRDISDLPLDLAV